MGPGFAVEIETMTVEPPGQPGVVGKSAGVGDRFKGNAGPAERRINAPEAARPPKVGQAGIDTHAGSGGNQQTVGFMQPLCGTLPGGGHAVVYMLLSVFDRTSG